MEVTCPHCNQTIRLVDDSAPAAEEIVESKHNQVEMSVTRVKSSAPLLPPGFGKQGNAENAEEPPVIPPVDMGGKAHAESPHTRSDESKILEAQEDGGEWVADSKDVRAGQAIEEERASDVPTRNRLPTQQVKSVLEQEAEQ